MFDFFVSIVGYLFIQPFQAEISEKLAAARAPQEIIQRIDQCARTAGPAMLNRGMQDWGWALGLGIKLTMGMTTLEKELSATSPSCAEALSTAKPFMQGQAA